MAGLQEGVESSSIHDDFLDVHSVYVNSGAGESAHPVECRRRQRHRPRDLHCATRVRTEFLTNTVERYFFLEKISTRLYFISG